MTELDLTLDTDWQIDDYETRQARFTNNPKFKPGCLVKVRTEDLNIETALYVVVVGMYMGKKTTRTYSGSREDFLILVNDEVTAHSIYDFDILTVQ